MSLPSPTKSFFDEYKKLITDFIWNGKQPKIRYSRLIQDYKNGGLKLVDLESKDLALKASWITRWQNLDKLDSENYRWLYVNLPIKTSEMWKVNLNAKDMRKCLRYTFDMSHHILNAWLRVTYSSELDMQKFEHSPVYYNTNIRVQNHPISIRTKHKEVIFTISQMVDPRTQEFYSFEVFRRVNTNVTIHYLQYYAIIKAIPQEWKAQISKAEFTQNNPINLDMIEEKENKRTSSRIYWHHVQKYKSDSNDSYKLQWENELKIVIPQETWQSLSKQVQKCTL